MIVFGGHIVPDGETYPEVIHVVLGTTPTLKGSEVIRTRKTPARANNSSNELKTMLYLKGIEDNGDTLSSDDMTAYLTSVKFRIRFPYIKDGECRHNGVLYSRYRRRNVSISMADFGINPEELSWSLSGVTYSLVDYDACSLVNKDNILSIAMNYSLMSTDYKKPFAYSPPSTLLKDVPIGRDRVMADGSMKEVPFDTSTDKWKMDTHSGEFTMNILSSNKMTINHEKIKSLNVEFTNAVGYNLRDVTLIYENEKILASQY